MKCLKFAIPMIAALCAPAKQAIAQNAKSFKATSAWALDYGDDYCRLMRDFNNGNEVVGLFLERTQPGPMVRLILVGNSVRLFRSSQEVGYRMSPLGGPRTTQKLRFQTSDGQQYLNLGLSTFADMPTSPPGTPPTMPPPYTRQGEVEVATKISGIALDRGLTNPMLLETGPLGDAAGALQACADDLIASWGLDAEKHKDLTRPVMPAQPTAGWIASDTVPFGEFAKLNGGNNELRVMVDRTGKATSCHIQWPTLNGSTNKKICDSVMKKSAFMPALDKSNQVIDSYWTSNIFFLMPPFGSL